MQLLDESESLTTSYQIVFKIKHGHNANVLRAGGPHVFSAQSLCDLMADVQLQHLVDSF